MSKQDPKARLRELSDQIARWRHTCRNERSRVWRYINEYETLRLQSPVAFREYCGATGLDPTHDGYDLLA